MTFGIRRQRRERIRSELETNVVDKKIDRVSFSDHEPVHDGLNWSRLLGFAFEEYPMLFDMVFDLTAMTERGEADSGSD